MRNPDEVWQVRVNGQVYDTTYGELPGWISDNALLETDQVRRGELRWLDAGKVPSLVPFFNAKAEGKEIPVVAVSTTVAETSDEDRLPDSFAAEAQEVSEATTEFAIPSIEPVPDLPAAGTCSIHPEVPSEYVCSTCLHPFCGECPEGFGASVRLCPYCGAMCEEIAKTEEKSATRTRHREDISKGFGLGDFGRSLAYPFKFKVSLLFGALMFALLSIGQGAGAMGGIFLIAAALFCFMLANALTFGVLANTIENFSKGVIGKNFMPSFDEFSTWEDVIHPFFLSIAVYASSFGLFIAVVAGMAWFAMSSVPDGPAPAGAASQESFAAGDAAKPDYLKSIIEKAREQNKTLGVEVGEDGLTDSQRATLGQEAEFRRLSAMAENYQKQQIEPAAGSVPQQSREEMSAMLGQFLQGASGFLILALLALLWGLFYFPAACAVAGYTRSFAATLNPLVGLDTIRHLGFDYVKVLGMVLLIGIGSVVSASILGMVFSPFNLPVFGNVPAKFFGGFVVFYFSIVFSVVLGFALYKNAEKLKLYKA